MLLVSLNQQIPTLSTHFFISELCLFINQAGQVQLQSDLNVAGLNLGGEVWGAV